MVERCEDYESVDRPDHHKSMKLSSEQLQVKKYFHQQQMKRQIVSSDTVGRYFFQRNWEPSYTCTTMVRLGCPGDGGKWVCDPHSSLLQKTPECIVYSIGSNNEFSFERAIHHFNPQCQIYAFDGTLTSSPSEKPQYVHYFPWNLGSYDSKVDRVFTLASIMRRLGHNHVSILKVDCEGCEYDSLSAQTFPATRGAIQQILVEVHFDGRPDHVHNFFRFMNHSGYAIFSKEANIMYSNGDAVEFSLLYVEEA